MYLIEYEVEFAGWLGTLTYCGLFESLAVFDRNTPLNFARQGYADHRILSVRVAAERGTEEER